MVSVRTEQEFEPGRLELGAYVQNSGWGKREDLTLCGS